MILRYSFFTLVFLTLQLYAFAQTGTISGRVTLPDGSPASFVNVTLKETKLGSATDSNGVYTIRSVEPGKYVLVISFVGYIQQEKKVDVVSGETSKVDLTLTERAEELEEVVVSDSRTLNEKTVDIGKSGIKSMDLPQSVLVIDATILKNQQVGKLSDVLMNTSGVYVMGTTGGVQEEIAGRGFSYGSNNTFKNGVRFNNGVMPEMSSLERVEILKGSSAILYGNVAAGGVLNLVTKKPLFEQGGEISYRAGSYGFNKPSLDIYGPVNQSKTLAFRMNTTYEVSNSFRDEVSSERIYFNPSFLVKAGRKTQILLEGDFLKDDRTLDYGIGAVNYEIADVPRNRFLGAKWSRYKGEQRSATVTVNHTLNEKFSLRALAAYQGYYNDQYSTTRPNASGQAVSEDGTWARGLQRSGIDQNYFIAQTDLVGKFETGSLKHQVLIGAEYDHYGSTSLSYTYSNPDIDNKNVYDTINIYDLSLYTQRTDIPSIALTRKTKNPVDRVGIYAQDMVSIVEKLKVLAGVRYSYIKSSSDVTDLTSQNFSSASYDDDPITSRFGIVYQPTKAVSLFSSYSNSFTLNTNLDINGNVLPPSFINQVEAGLKSELLRGFLSANVTAYQIVNDNLSQPVLGENNVYELAGEVTSKGVELDVMSRVIHGMSFIAGYSYNDTRYTKSTQYIVGSKLRYNPAHTANASMFYHFANTSLRNLSVGFTTYYVGERMAGRSTQVTVPDDTRKLIPLPDYFLFDVTAGYMLQNVSIRVKVSNLLNELSYNVHDDNSVNPIAPRMFSATLAYKW
ncbi:MAG TPA: TonB-dependent receptor [Cyclobacteriaceae bacterium]|nr:TonB-dependent receptor [Cyclobacteriaceae bacterium]